MPSKTMNTGGQRQQGRARRSVRRRARASAAIDELDVQGTLAFAERILPRASVLWVQASLDYKQRPQQLFFPGDRVRRHTVQSNRRNRTAFQLLGADWKVLMKG